MYKLDQNQTPLFDALMEYYDNNTVPFHVPGHKKGVGVEKRFREFIGDNAFSIDVTIFKQVDSLHKPTGPIKLAQELAADAYNSDATLFCVHGTSGAIQAMIMSVVREGEKIIIPRNVHKSVTAGVILSGSYPIYMNPEIDSDGGFALNVTPETVKKTLELNPDTKAVLIANPTYYGVATDVESIAKIVHSYGIPLIVDEAHGPHLRFTNRLPVSSMDAGADICAQSTHKIVSSLTQSSMLQIKKGYVDINRVKTNLSLLQTTSPSYILLASLDCTRKQLALEGRELIDYAIELSTYARNEINKIKGLYCFGKEILNKKGAFSWDSTKVLITCKDLGITGYDLERILAEDYFIQLEMADMYNALAVMSYGDTKESVDKLIDALKQISNDQTNKVTKKITVIDVPAIPETALTPREAFNSTTASLPLIDSVGLISAEFLMAYPPGIPVLCPGEIVTKEIVDYVLAMKNAGLYVQGTADPEVNYINIVTDLNF